jgi:hypothetical protein
VFGPLELILKGYKYRVIMSDMKENLFLKDIRESGLKAEEGCCCQVCRILRQQEDKYKQDMDALLNSNMDDVFKDTIERSNKDIVNTFGIPKRILGEDKSSYPSKAAPYGVCKVDHIS